ncbi:MAG TPA: GNAT family N-acetyltransferase [Actinomycetota bacterium]|nr:GNAT family N-acetyltransferase [Actinomycetota bacterium]
MNMQIRPIRDDEFDELATVIFAAFGDAPRPESIRNERRVAEIDRCLAAFDDGRIVGGAAAYSFRFSVPGAEVATAGVTSVGVLPTHRRQGINTALMRKVLDDAHERGEPLAALFASEGGIYGRFGFGLGSFSCATDLETERSRFVRGYRPSGTVRLHAKDEAIPPILAVYEDVRRTRPGMPALDERWIEYRVEHRHDDGEPKPFFAVHRTAGVADGYAIYTVKHAWPDGIPHLEISVSDLMATGPDAYADIWRFLLDHDLVRRVTSWARPVDDPLLHLLAEPRRLRLAVRDGLWVRLVDLSSALCARAYAGRDRIVLEVRDDFCAWNDGRFALDAGPEGPICEPSTEEPDLVCDVNVLGAAYLGGVTFRQLSRAGRVEEGSPGALARADALFGWDPAPWCPFVF